MNRDINLYGKVALCVLLLSVYQSINNNNKFQKDDRIHTENFQSIHNTQVIINTESLYLK